MAEDPAQMIGTGSYGCVFYPALPCQQIFQTAIEPYPYTRNQLITKILNREECAVEEMRYSPFFSMVDRDMNYFLYPVRHCLVRIPRNLQTERYQDCELFNINPMGQGGRAKAHAKADAKADAKAHAKAIAKADAKAIAKAHAKAIAKALNGGTGDEPSSPWQRNSPPSKRICKKKTPTKEGSTSPQAGPSTLPQTGDISPSGCMAGFDFYSSSHFEARTSTSKSPQPPFFSPIQRRPVIPVNYREDFHAVEIPYGGRTLDLYIKDLKKSVNDVDELRLRILRLLTRVWDGITILHQNNYIHRDIKIDNIMILEREGQPPESRLIDFGKMITTQNTPNTPSVSQLIQKSADPLNVHAFTLALDPPEFRLNSCEEFNLYFDTEEFQMSENELLGNILGENIIKKVYYVPSKVPGSPNLTYFFKNSLDKYRYNASIPFDSFKIDVYDIGLLLMNIEININELINSPLQPAYLNIIRGCMNPYPADRFNLAQLRAALNAFTVTQGGKIKRIPKSVSVSVSVMKKTEETASVGKKTYVVYRGARGKKYIRTKGGYIGLKEARAVAK
jgi:hypothetical protein